MADYIYNEEGKVALVYYQPIPRVVKYQDKVYSFDCQHGVSLGWVDKEDVDGLLTLKGGCCDRKRQMLFVASQPVYTHWLTGRR